MQSLQLMSNDRARSKSGTIDRCLSPNLVRQIYLGLGWASWLMLLSRLLHLVPHDEAESEEYSLFQGFSTPILRISPILTSILALPPDLVELFIPHRHALTMRVRGGYGYHIVPFQYDAVGAVPLGREMPFVIIHSDEHTFEWVKGFISKLEQPILHVSDVPDSSATLRSRFNRGTLRRYAKAVYQWLEPEASRLDLLKLRSIITMKPDRFSRPTPLRSAQHFATLPNELALRSIGFKLATPNPLPTFAEMEGIPSVLDGDIYKRVIESADAVQSIRNQVLDTPSILGTPSLDLIVAAPALYKFHYVGTTRLPPADRALKEITKVARLVTRLSTIRNYLTPEEAPLFQTESSRHILATRNRELAAFATSVAIKAATRLVPTLRLPPAVNLIRNNLGMIGGCARGDNPHRTWKLERLAGRAVEKIESTVPTGYLPFLSGWDKGIKLYTDVPLEWMRIDGIPLAIRHKVSRIPCTPGNILNLQSIRNENIDIEVQHLAKVLVVRSFLPTEKQKLRNALESALIRNNLRELVTFVDISSVDGLIEALAQTEYSVLVFDGHGTHSEETDLGGLIIGGQPINVWSLRKHLNLPPIVLLSACDTHPIDASHASTANGLFAAGCTTVLATLMPVNAIYSARFIATILGALFQLATNQGDSFKLSWNELVTFALRKVYFDELDHRLAQVLGPPQGNMDKLPDASDLQYCEWRLGALEKKWKLRASSLKEFIARQFRYTECLNYIQMGNPELVNLCSPAYMTNWQERSALIEKNIYDS